MSREAGCISCQRGRRAPRIARHDVTRPAAVAITDRGRVPGLRRRRAIRAASSRSKARRSTVRRGELAVPHRPVRVRQEHAAQPHRRADDADDRRDHHRRRARARPLAQEGRLCVSGERALSRGAPSSTTSSSAWRFRASPRAEREQRARRGAGRGRARRFRRPLPGAAFGRHEAARAAGARAGLCRPRSC